MKFRYAGSYPPYVFLATLVIRHDDPIAAYQKAFEIARKLQMDRIEVLGPAEISMRSRQARYRLILKDKDDEHLIETLWNCALWFEKDASKCRMDINVHPMNLEE